jgi:hypothetical protein
MWESVKAWFTYKPREVWPGGSPHYRMIRRYPFGANPAQWFIHIKHPDGGCELDVPLAFGVVQTADAKMTHLDHYDAIGRHWVTH